VQGSSCVGAAVVEVDNTCFVAKLSTFEAHLVRWTVPSAASAPVAIKVSWLVVVVVVVHLWFAGSVALAVKLGLQ
jgi:hypothetical protein